MRAAEIVDWGGDEYGRGLGGAGGLMYTVEIGCARLSFFWVVFAKLDHKNTFFPFLYYTMRKP